MALLTPIRTRPRMDRRSTVWQVDWVLVLSVVALSFIGAMLIWSATRARTSLTDGNQYAFLVRHALNFAIGLVLAIGAAITDHRRVRILAPVLYAASIVGLVLVLVPGVGSTINGSRSWIQLPFMSVQPSEFAKLAVIVGMALLIAEKSEADRNENARTIDVAQAIGVAAVPVVLVMLQPDLGTVMVLGSIVFGIIAVSGVPKRWMLGLLTAATTTPAVSSPSIQRFGTPDTAMIPNTIEPSTITVPRSGCSITRTTGTAATPMACATSMVRAFSLRSASLFSAISSAIPTITASLANSLGWTDMNGSWIHDRDPLMVEPTPGTRTRTRPTIEAAYSTGARIRTRRWSVIAAPIASTRPIAKFSACRTRNAYWFPSVSDVRARVADQISIAPMNDSATTLSTRTQSTCHTVDRRSIRGRVRIGVSNAMPTSAPQRLAC